MKTWNAIKRQNFVKGGKKIKEWEFKKSDSLLIRLSKTAKSRLLRRFYTSNAPSPAQATIDNIPHVLYDIPAGDSNSPPMFLGRSGTGKLVTAQTDLIASGYLHFPVGDCKQDLRDSLVMSLQGVYPPASDNKSVTAKGKAKAAPPNKDGAKKNDAKDNKAWASLPAQVEKDGMMFTNMSGHLIMWKLWCPLSRLDNMSLSLIRESVLLFDEPNAFMIIARQHCKSRELFHSHLLWSLTNII
jgi:hypothetical protein